jgi:hypothetical protein
LRLPICAQSFIRAPGADNHQRRAAVWAGLIRDVGGDEANAAGIARFLSAQFSGHRASEYRSDSDHLSKSSHNENRIAIGHLNAGVNRSPASVLLLKRAKYSIMKCESLCRSYRRFLKRLNQSKVLQPPPL